VNLEDVRRFCVSLPAASEKPHFDMRSFRVRGRIFATVTADEAHLHVFVDEDETRAAVAEDPAAVEELWWGKQLPGVRVDVAGADATPVFELLEESWRRKAPKRLVAKCDQRGENSKRVLDRIHQKEKPMTDVPGEAARLMEAINVRSLRDRPADWSVGDQAFFWRLAKEGPNDLWVGRYTGTSPWERHRSGDELLYTVEGSIDVTVLTTDGDMTTSVPQGSIFVVPTGLWHRVASDGWTVQLGATPEPTEHSQAVDPRQGPDTTVDPATG
jgi:quercetin dioxygenase-like cupin family protein